MGEKRNPPVGFHVLLGMLRIGDDTTGFSIEVQAPGRVLVTGWGFWSVQVALAFASSVVDACRAQPKGLKLVVDMSRLKPMRDEGQRSFALLMRSLRDVGVSHTSVITTNPLTKLQLVRLASESGAGSAIEWSDEALDLGRGA
jgi:hypothetical protein